MTTEWHPFGTPGDDDGAATGHMDGLRAAVNGHDVRKAHTNSHGSVLITEAPRGQSPKIQPGSRMIAIATGLLFALGIGLLAVSFAAQYRYVDAQRHQHAASLIEAGALDVGMVIFALLALGLARAGLPAKAPRVLVVACAAGSALMNYAAADVSSPRSVLAFCMPPLFLAVVVDQVVVTVRRHVLGMREGSSPWSAAGTAALWVLRTLFDPWHTGKGVRQMVLIATPLPEAAPKKAISSEREPKATRDAGPRPGSKTSRFIDLVVAAHGPLAHIPLERVSPIATELASKVELDAGSARTALRTRVIAAQDGTQS